MLSNTAWSQVVGVGNASFAQSDFVDASQDAFAQEIDAFRGQDAQAAMAQVRQVFASCASFVSTQDGQTAHMRLVVKPLPGVGDDAVVGELTAPEYTGGTTLVAVRVGQLVVFTVDGAQTDTGAGGVDLTRTLVQRVTAKN
jgi:hypothetical protein